eukprot:jgi/Bigna1/134839/aug1.27_g9547
MIFVALATVLVMIASALLYFAGFLSPSSTRKELGRIDSGGNVTTASSPISPETKDKEGDSKVIASSTRVERAALPENPQQQKDIAFCRLFIGKMQSSSQTLKALLEQGGFGSEFRFLCTLNNIRHDFVVRAEQMIRDHFVQTRRDGEIAADTSSSPSSLLSSSPHYLLDDQEYKTVSAVISRAKAAPEGIGGLQRLPILESLEDEILLRIGRGVFANYEEIIRKVIEANEEVFSKVPMRRIQSILYEVFWRENPEIIAALYSQPLHNAKWLMHGKLTLLDERGRRRGKGDSTKRTKRKEKHRAVRRRSSSDLGEGLQTMQCRIEMASYNDDVKRKKRKKKKQSSRKTRMGMMTMEKQKEDVIGSVDGKDGICSRAERDEKEKARAAGGGWEERFVLIMSRSGADDEGEQKSSLAAASSSTTTTTSSSRSSISSSSSPTSSRDEESEVALAIELIDARSTPLSDGDEDEARRGFSIRGKSPLTNKENALLHLEDMVRGTYEMVHKFNDYCEDTHRFRRLEEDLEECIQDLRHSLGPMGSSDFPWIVLGAVAKTLVQASESCGLMYPHEAFRTMGGWLMLYVADSRERLDASENKFRKGTIQLTRSSGADEKCSVM